MRPLSVANHASPRRQPGRRRPHGIARLLSSFPLFSRQPVAVENPPHLSDLAQSLRGRTCHMPCPLSRVRVVFASAAPPTAPWGRRGRRHRGTSGRMFSRARTFFRVGDIPVRADASWFVVMALLTWSFWTRFNLTYPAGTAAALFSLSVIAHEIAHALEARHRGIPVGGITMYLFGGATEVYSDEVRKPGDEFALTAVGLWTSI